MPSTYLTNTLAEHGLSPTPETINALSEKSLGDLFRMKGIGRISIAEIYELAGKPSPIRMKRPPQEVSTRLYNSAKYEMGEEPTKETFQKLAKRSDVELLALHNFGRKSLRELRKLTGTEFDPAPPRPSTRQQRVSALIREVQDWDKWCKEGSIGLCDTEGVIQEWSDEGKLRLIVKALRLIRD